MCAAACWSNTTVRKLVREHAGHAQKVVVIDWHTGVGAYNDVAYLFMHPFVRTLFVRVLRPGLLR